LKSRPRSFYYAVTAVSHTGIEGPISNLAPVVTDSTAPVAQSITYTPQGPHGPGTVVNVEVFESKKKEDSP